jgi:hypothetical protein
MEQQIGPHAVWTEEPDLFCMRLSGTLEGPDLTVLLDKYALWLKLQGAGYVLADLKGLTAVAPSARDAHKEQWSRIQDCPCACFGVSFGLRVVIDMMMRARRLLNPASSTPMSFFATEREARAFVVSRRDLAHCYIQNTRATAADSSML